MDEDYYNVLGVKRDASQADIQRAYRDLARKYHPDMNPDDKTAKAKFQQVQRAYDVLNNPEKREMYDRYGSSFESAGAGGPWGGGGGTWRGFRPGGGAGGFEEFDFSQMFGGRGSEGFADIFRQFSGGRAQSRRGGRQRGSDLHHEIQIPFGTAIQGGEASLTVQHPGGKQDTISVKIPPGIEDGKKIRVRGQGDRAAGGGPPGDLLIQVHVAPHPCYRRQGKNLEVTVPVTLAEAAMGAKIDVPTPQGVIALSVPPGTSSGKRLRLKGLGVSPPKGPSGDLLAEIRIVLPEVIDEQTAEWIRQIDAHNPMNPRADLLW